MDELSSLVAIPNMNHDIGRLKDATFKTYISTSSTA